MMNVQCQLCPKQCVIAPGESGDCRIRINSDGVLQAVTYEYPCSIHVDPVEKKPLFHFLPGTSILSLATVGCNLHCINCQNWEISQQNPEESTAYEFPIDSVPVMARRYQCQSVAYTYTDPVVYYEYALDAARKVREQGLKNVLVTAGYINEDPWRELCRVTDAANIDLKALSDRFYQDICSATLAPVLRALETARAMGVEVEVTNLVIPTLNDHDDDIKALCRWVVENMGKDTPLHFSRFFPQYRLRNLPPTPSETLSRARDIARSEGLYYVYIGNLLEKDGGTTFCPSCGRVLIRRKGYTILENVVTHGGCPYCEQVIYGVWQ